VRVTRAGGGGDRPPYPTARCVRLWSDSGVDVDEVDEALERAEEIVAYAERVTDTLPVF
jgi:hypothetical protein